MELTRVLVLSRRDVAELLDADALVDALATAMVDLSEGRASMPPRGAAHVAERRSMLAAMPAFLPSASALTTKLVSLFPDNRHRPTHQAVICCFDPVDGAPLALMDGTHITATRTAAGSVLAARYLARADSSVLAIIGTGVQARSHADAFRSWPALQTVLVGGRDPDLADQLAEELRDNGLPADVGTSIEDAVRGADIVCATTHADAPVVRRDWVRPGTHVSSVGYNSAGQGEVDVALVGDALVVVESRATVLAPPPSGAVELRSAVEQGVVPADFAPAEIGEVIAGTAPGRADDETVTLYKSVGVAVQDAAAAALVLAAAEDRGVGTYVDLD